MSATELLRALYRIFPNATELAVSQETADQFEQEMVANYRFTPPFEYRPRVWLKEPLPGGITATRLPMIFRDRHLTLVEQ